MSSPEPLCGAQAGFTLVRFLVSCTIANRFLDHRTVWTLRPEYSMEPDPNPDVKIKMVCANIQILGQKKNLKRVHITGVASSEEAAKMKQAILSQMDQMDIEVTVGGSVIADQKSLEQMAQSDAVVFVERVRDSVLKEIEKEIEICTEQEVPIIGAVAMN